jgi:tRNA-uridine 2-sulfurtransferase
VIDRERLYGISGRSRTVQMELAVQFGIGEYPNPAGGCLLTDPQFSHRVRDLFDHQEEIDLADMELLRLGRHFRVDGVTKLIVGRNEQENMTLVEYLASGRVLFEPEEFPAPSVLLLGSPNDAAERLEAWVRRRAGILRGEHGAGLPAERVALSEALERSAIEKMQVG